MARKIWKLNKFDKGLNSYTDPKDISDSEWATLDDVNVSKVGIAKPLGVPTRDTSVHNTEVGDLISGKGLYKYNSENAFMSDLDDDSWHSLVNTQNAGSDNALSQATFGIKSLVWLFDDKPTNITIQFTLKVNGSPIMSAIDVLSGNLASNGDDSTSTSTNRFNKHTMVANGGSGGLTELWEYDSVALNTNIPHQVVKNIGDDSSRGQNTGESPVYNSGVGGAFFWDVINEEAFETLELNSEPITNLNNPNLIFSATYDSGNPPLPNGTLDFNNYYMLGFYAWDGYVEGIEHYGGNYDLGAVTGNPEGVEAVIWNYVNSAEAGFYVPFSKANVDQGGEAKANYQKARLSFMSELINAINSYSGGSAANQFSAEFVNNVGTVDETVEPEDFIYIEPRTGIAAGNAGGDITADITCTGGTNSGMFYGSGINLLDDIVRYGQGGYEGGGGTYNEFDITDIEVADADGGSMVLQGDTAVSTGNAGTVAETWELTIFGNPNSGKTINIEIQGQDSMGDLSFSLQAIYGTNEAFANAIGSLIGAESDYSCSSASEVTGYSHAFAPYKIVITGGTTTLLGGYNVTVYWETPDAPLDSATGVGDEQLALISKTESTISTLDSVAIKKTDFKIWTEHGSSWLNSFSNSNLESIFGANATNYLNWFYTPTQNNDPIFFDEGSVLRISEGNYELLQDLEKKFLNNDIQEVTGGSMSPMEPNPSQWIGYKDISNHFKDKDRNKYFTYNTQIKGYFIGKTAKIWSYTKDSSDATAKIGVNSSLDTDVGTGDGIGINNAELQFYMVRDTSTGGGIDWSGNIKVYAAACYDDGSESLPGHYFSTFAGTSTNNYFGNVGDGYFLKIELLFRPQNHEGFKCFDDARINGVRLYYTHSEENFSTYWNLGKIDFNRGFIKAATVDTIDNTLGNEARYEWRDASLQPEDGGTSGTAYNTSATNNLTVYNDVSNSYTIEYKEMPKSEAYEDINGHSVDVGTLNVGYKAICIAGRRTFIGNLRVWNGSNYEYYNDRIVVSPVNSLDTFPYPDNILDFDISDGDEIIALASFGDKVIQFKKKIVYMLNISTGLAKDFFVEEKHKWKGILDKNHFCTTDEGIFWLNERGAWLYDGEEIKDLFILEDTEKSQQKIDDEEWSSFITVNSLVGYNAESREIIVVKNHTHATSADADCFIFSLVVNSWTKGKGKFFSTANKSMTNFQNIGNLGKIAYLVEEDPGGAADSGEIR